MAVKALAFDVFGTLVDWRRPIARAFRASGAPGDAAELADDWRGRYVPILLEVNDDRRPWGDLDELHRATLDELLAERGIDLPDDARGRLVAAWHRLDGWPDAPGGLATLRRERITAALSNGHMALLVELARHAGLRFDCLLPAELADAYKPAPAVYLMAARLLRLRPDEVMLVAAHPGDLAAARSAGLRTAFVDRPLEYGPGSPARSDPDADVSVESLDELAGALRR
jgi:2-haloacid dehalogenase